MVTKFGWFIFVALFVASGCCRCFAEQGSILVQVTDTSHRPIRGIEIGIDGFGGSKPTGDDGKAKIPIGKDSRAGEPVSVSILHSPPGRDMEIISPWGFTAPIPAFEDKPGNFLPIVVVDKGNREALQDGSVISSLVKKVNQANAPKTAGERQPVPDPKANLALVAAQYGLKPKEIDEAIKAWSKTPRDAEDAGLAAFYLHNYPEASDKLAESLHREEERVAATETDLAQQKANLADTARFLGYSLYLQGRFSEAVEADAKALKFKVDDAGLMNDMASALIAAGKLEEAEKILRRALEINKATRPPTDPQTTTIVANLGSLLSQEGRYSEAEPFLWEAMTMDQRLPRQNLLMMAYDYNNLATLDHRTGKFQLAEKMQRWSCEAFETTLGSYDEALAYCLKNLAVILVEEHKFVDAEAQLQRAFSIYDKSPRKDHPDWAEIMMSKAFFLTQKPESGLAARAANLAEAERLLRGAIKIDEDHIGRDAPIVGMMRAHLADVLNLRGQYVGSESEYRRALQILDSAKPSDTPQFALVLNDFAFVLRKLGKNDEAVSLMERAIAIDDRHLGADDPNTKALRRNLTLFSPISPAK